MNTNLSNFLSDFEGNQKTKNELKIFEGLVFEAVCPF